MPLSRKNDLKQFAAARLVHLYETHDYGQIYDILCTRSPGFRNVDREKFGREYLAVRLALACHAWAVACRQNVLLDEDLQKIFLQTVLATFQSEKVKDLAASFGEYACLPAETEDELAVLAILERCFDKLSAPKRQKTAKEECVDPAFQILVEATEGLRASLENEFDAYLIEWSRQDGISF